MKKTCAFIYCFPLFFSFLLSCNGIQEQITLSKVILDLPSAINAPESRENKKGVSAATIFNTISLLYSPIRDEFNPLAAQALDYTKNIFFLIDENIFHNRPVMAKINRDNLLETDFDDNGTEGRLRISKNESTYTVELWQKNDTAWDKALYVEFTLTNTVYTGTLYTALPVQGSAEKILYKIDFNTADVCGHSMVISIINLEYAENGSENIPSRIWLKVCKSGNRFYAAGNRYSLNVNIGRDMDFSNEVMDQLYDGEYVPGTTVVNANYIYTAAVDLTSGNGAASVALVPETDNRTAEIFDIYSVGNIYREAVAQWIKNTTDPDLIQIINDILTDAGEVLISKDSSTNAIFEALQQVKEYLGEQSDETLDGILFVVQLVNPGYFSGESGFTGNDLINTPSWAADVPNFYPFPILSAAALAADAFLFAIPDENPPTL